MRGTKFRYSGRTEREILTESLNALRQQHLLNNTSPSKRKANSVPGKRNEWDKPVCSTRHPLTTFFIPATPSSPQGDLAEIRKIFSLKIRSPSNDSHFPSGYSSLPRSTMSEPMGCSNQINSGFLPDSTIPLLETVSEEARRQTGKRRKIIFSENTQ